MNFPIAVHVITGQTLKTLNFRLKSRQLQQKPTTAVVMRSYAPASIGFSKTVPYDGTAAVLPGTVSVRDEGDGNQQQRRESVQCRERRRGVGEVWGLNGGCDGAPDVMCSHEGAFVLAVTQQVLRVKGRVTASRDKRFIRDWIFQCFCEHRLCNMVIEIWFNIRLILPVSCLSYSLTSRLFFWSLFLKMEWWLFFFF